MHPFLEKMRAAVRLGFNAAHRPPPTAATHQLLESAAWNQDNVTVRELITQWPQLVHHAPQDGVTALHTAAAGMDAGQIDWLLAAGANIHARDQEGNTPLHYAAQAYCAATIETLLRGKAEIDAVNNKGETPLYYAIMFERPDNLQVLIAAGAKDSVPRHDGETPRSLAPKENKQRRGDQPPAGVARPDMLRALDHAQADRKQAFENAPILAQDMTLKPAPTIRKRSARKP